MQNQNDNFEKFRPLKIKIMETIHTFAEEFIAKINEQSDAELDGFMGLPWAPKLQENEILFPFIWLGKPDAKDLMNIEVFFQEYLTKAGLRASTRTAPLKYDERKNGWVYFVIYRPHGEVQ